MGKQSYDVILELEAALRSVIELIETEGEAKLLGRRPQWRKAAEQSVSEAYLGLSMLQYYREGLAADEADERK